ncbi:hypothetical protein [Arenimonas oryziterrae]|uniref:hypothetical protein n=1 Tax=Arenimonas oryziterrae TaxID=498055 RepID=UPI0012DC0844|nr:hypothetical protein [Arenimonas oryziterrae]
MNISRVSILFFVSLALYACAAQKMRPDFDFENGNAIEFLQYLKTPNGVVDWYSFDAPYSCWVRQKDVEQLIRLLDSTEKSRSVRLAIASRILRGSTEGDEAAFMIYGFREGEYPSRARSSPVSTEEKDAIREWWRDYRSGRVTKDAGILKCEGPKK